MQGWRVSYYSSGIVALIIGGLVALSLREPARTVIGEETEETNETTTSTTQQTEQKKEKAWKVMLQPRFIMLCIAASIRHTGKIKRWLVFIITMVYDPTEPIDLNSMVSVLR